MRLPWGQSRQSMVTGLLFSVHCGSMSQVVAGIDGGSPMKHSVYAMDTHFYNSIGSYPYEVRCEMLRELGLDAGP